MQGYFSQYKSEGGFGDDQQTAFYLMLWELPEDEQQYCRVATSGMEKLSNFWELVALVYHTMAEIQL